MWEYDYRTIHVWLTHVAAVLVLNGIVEALCVRAVVLEEVDLLVVKCEQAPVGLGRAGDVDEVAMLPGVVLFGVCWHRRLSV